MFEIYEADRFIPISRPTNYPAKVIIKIDGVKDPLKI